MRELVYFNKERSIGQLFGFHQKVLEPHPSKTYRSDQTENILRIKTIRLECNIISGSYVDNTANQIFNVREKVFSDESFVLIHRIIKHLNQTMKFELLSKIKTCTCFLTKVTLIFKELFEMIHRMDLQTDNVTTFIKNNCMADFLDEIKYEINECEIDRTQFIDMINTLKKLYLWITFKVRIY